MEVSGRRKAQHDDVGVQLLCDPCLVVKDDAAACFYCRDCNEFLCYKCSKQHRESKFLRSHVLLGGENMPRRKLTTGNLNVCPKDGDIVKYYCPGHQTFCCLDCATTDHSKCEVNYIKEIANEFEKSSEYKAFRSELVRLKEQLHNVKECITGIRADLRESYGKILSDIQSFRSDINVQLDSLEKEMKDDITRLVTGYKSDVTLQETCSETMLSEIEELTSVLNAEEEFKQNELLVMSFFKATTAIEKMQRDIADVTKKTNASFEFQFKRNVELQSTLKCFDNFGAIKFGKDESEANSCVFERKIDIIHSSDKNDCWITGCVELDDDIIALADQNNNCIKVVDIDSGKIISYFQLKQKPWDITRVSGKRIAVSCDDTIVFLKVQRRPCLFKEKELPATGEFSGIVYSEGILIASIVDPNPTIKILNMDGRFLQTVGTGLTGESLISPFYVTTAGRKQKIFVADYDQNKIKRLNKYGEVEASYKDEFLSGPYGMAYDGKAGFYVVGSKSSNIHHITDSCEQIGIILDEEDGIESPQAVAFCKESGKIVLSHNQFAPISLRNSISVYRMTTSK